jgi:hypothetical protein
LVGGHLERIKEFKHYVVLVALNRGGYWMRSMTAEEVTGMKAIPPSPKARYPYLPRLRPPRPGRKAQPSLTTIPCNGHIYRVDRNSVFTLHGWYPFLKENRWNAWRQVYNMFYRYFVATGLLYYEELKESKKSKDPVEAIEPPILPMTWSVAQEKWSPGLVQAVNLSRLEERYNKHINFGSFAMSWKMALVIGVVVIIALLIFTGRLQF